MLILVFVEMQLHFQLLYSLTLHSLTFTLMCLFRLLLLLLQLYRHTHDNMYNRQFKSIDVNGSLELFAAILQLHFKGVEMRVCPSPASIQRFVRAERVYATQSAMRLKSWEEN